MFVIAVYTLLLNEVHISWKPAKKTIGFIAKHSFTVYMIHYLIIELIGDRFYVGYSAKVGFAATYLVCFVLSVMAAAVFNFIIEKTIQTPLKKLLKI